MRSIAAAATVFRASTHLGCEVHDGVHLLGREQVEDQVQRLDVALHKLRTGAHPVVSTAGTSCSCSSRASYPLFQLRQDCRPGRSPARELSGSQETMLSTKRRFSPSDRTTASEDCMSNSASWRGLRGCHDCLHMRCRRNLFSDEVAKPACVVGYVLGRSAHSDRAGEGRNLGCRGGGGDPHLHVLVVLDRFEVAQGRAVVELVEHYDLGREHMGVGSAI